MFSWGTRWDGRAAAGRASAAASAAGAGTIGTRWLHRVCARGCLWEEARGGCRPFGRLLAVAAFPRKSSVPDLVSNSDTCLRKENTGIN